MKACPRLQIRLACANAHFLSRPRAIRMTGVRRSPVLAPEFHIEIAVGERGTNQSELALSDICADFIRVCGYLTVSCTVGFRVGIKSLIDMPRGCGHACVRQCDEWDDTARARDMRVSEQGLGQYKYRIIVYVRW